MPLIKLDSSATNGKPENFTTTFSNFVLEDNTEYEVAMVALSMNYSYPNVSVKNEIGSHRICQWQLSRIQY